MKTRRLFVPLPEATIGGTICAAFGYAWGAHSHRLPGTTFPFDIANSITYHLALYAGLFGVVAGAIISTSIVLTAGRMSPIAALFKLIWWTTVGTLLGFLGDMVFAALRSMARGDFRLPFSFIPLGPNGALIGLLAGALVGLFIITRGVLAPSKDETPRI